MKITEVPIPGNFIKILESEGIEELYPPQEQAVNSGVLEGKNIVLETPTASGKTLTAELAIAKVLEKGGRAVYIVPLRALAYEKYVEFKKYELLGYKVHLEMGDLDSSKFYKINYDILVATAEKCDSILRARPDFFEGTGILVMDEIHLITTDRGPVYEIIISKFKKLFSQIQVLGLSATIGNARELSNWLGAKLVSSDWRPVKLTEEVAVSDDKFSEIQKVVRKNILKGGQVLIFVNSRRSTEAVAEKLGKTLNLKDAGGSEAQDNINKISNSILKALSSPTKQCRRLAMCVKHRTAFHHAGITNKQRTLVEDAFKAGLIAAIVATPTLSAGVNLPSRTVIIRDLMRYTGRGMNYIPVLEYKQMIGRAGRPKYDRVGKALAIAKSNDENEFIIENYINGTPEPIYSQLGVDPVLRFHILAAIASDFARTTSSVVEFFKGTFFGYQYDSNEGLGSNKKFENNFTNYDFKPASEYKTENNFENKIVKIIAELKEWKFIHEIKNILLPTNLGKRISELYIDPQTANNYIKIMRIAEENDHFPALGLLEMLCDAVEMPLLWLNRNEEQHFWNKISGSEHELLRKIDAYGLDATFLERFKTAIVFEKWINEYSENAIMNDHNVAPGLLNQKLQIAEWLCYSAGELADILNLRNTKREINKLEIRIKHGIKEELIPLVKIKGIGRVRARKLFDAGFETRNDLKKADVKILEKLIGKKVAGKVKEQVE